MAGELVLITGGSSHLGYATLVHALTTGYHVRAAVRSESAMDKIRAAPSVQPYLEHVEFQTVEDITKKGAFDQAVEGATYIIHTASPLARALDNFEETVIQPAVGATAGILESASKAPSVKRVVLNETTLTEPQQAPYSNAFEAYIASKILALRATKDFIQESHPPFSVINLEPAFLVGKNELATTPEAVLSGSNAIILGALLGTTLPSPRPGNTVHVDDVARAQVESLSPKIKGNQDFVLSSGGLAGTDFDDALEIVQRRFPEVVKEGVLPLGGSTQASRYKVDTSKAEATFGAFQDYEAQIVSLVGHYVEVVEKGKKGAKDAA